MPSSLVLLDTSRHTLEELRASYGQQRLTAYAEYLRTGMLTATATKYGMSVNQLQQLHRELRNSVDLNEE